MKQLAFFAIATLLFGGKPALRGAAEAPSPSLKKARKAEPEGRKPSRRRPKKRKKTIATFPADPEKAPSYRYAQMTRDACEATLKEREIHFESIKEARGVRAPVRIPQGIDGIRYHTGLPPKKDAASPFTIFDCRLVLALDDFGNILKRHRIDDVVMFSAWRPPGKKWPKDKEAKRHPGGLAIDIARFGQWEPIEPSATEEDAKSGERAAPKSQQAATGPKKEPEKRRVWLSIEKDFHGRIGDPTCKPNSKPRKNTKKALELRAILCEAAEGRMFTSMLTPNYDKAHFNHFHFEVTANVRWRILQ